MATVRVRANANIYGLEPGDLADVDNSGEFAALIDAGLLTVVPTTSAPAPSTDEVLDGDSEVGVPAPRSEHPVDFTALDALELAADDAAAAAEAEAQAKTADAEES